MKRGAIVTVLVGGVTALGGCRPKVDDRPIVQASEPESVGRESSHLLSTAVAIQSAARSYLDESPAGEEGRESPHAVNVVAEKLASASVERIASGLKEPFFSKSHTTGQEELIRPKKGTLKTWSQVGGVVLAALAVPFFVGAVRTPPAQATTPEWDFPNEAASPTRATTTILGDSRITIPEADYLYLRNAQPTIRKKPFTPADIKVSNAFWMDGHQIRVLGHSKGVKKGFVVSVSPVGTTALPPKLSQFPRMATAPGLVLPVYEPSHPQFGTQAFEKGTVVNELYKHIVRKSNDRLIKAIPIEEFRAFEVQAAVQASKLGLSPKIHAVWQSGGHVYISMDFVAGESLRSLETSAEELKKVGRRVGEYLSKLAEVRIGYADLHEGQVIRNNRGELVLIDFGEAYWMDSPEQARRFSQMNVLMDNGQINAATRSRVAFKPPEQRASSSALTRYWRFLPPALLLISGAALVAFPELLLTAPSRTKLTNPAIERFLGKLAQIIARAGLKAHMPKEV